MRDWILFVEDIFQACVDIESYVKDLSYEAFLDDKKTRDATIHNLLIIGESVKQIPNEILEEYPAIEWRKIAGLRDIIAHSYFNIKSSLLWNIIVSKIHPLKVIAESILSEKT
ncbi:DUF86 domain-containing protein [Methanospirillum sp.]|uniref:HepT-like ribonuclease domain-containing protein n=1 Tax=Methanospirillum sp. TaxID=45200 RepID=UPI0035A18F79